MALLQSKNYSGQCWRTIGALLLICLQFTNGVSDLDCDFEAGNLCQWQNYDVTPGHDSSGVWTLKSRPSDQPGGHCAGLERNGSSAATAAGVQGLLLGPVVTTMPHSTPACLQFAYVFHGQPSDQLSVYLVDSRLWTGPLVWQLSGTASGLWHTGSVPFYYDQPFRLAFHGNVSGTAVVAIDDIIYDVNRESCRIHPLNARADQGVHTLVLNAPADECHDNSTADCWSRPDGDCFGIYEAWSRANCPLRCGFCPGKLPPCEDELPYCDRFENSTCSDPSYAVWARKSCRKFCGMCFAPTPPSGPVTSTSSTTVEGQCDDDPAVDCWSKPDEDCFGIYEPWSRAHCPLRCGYCPGKHAPCEDTVTNCDRFGRVSCQDPIYALWARKSCRHYCDLCRVPTPPIG